MSKFVISNPPSTSPRRRARLLMIAYTCRPGQGSEGGIGWNRAVQAGRFVDTWVICEARECEAEIRKHIRQHGPVPGVTFVFVPFSNLQSKLIRTPGCYYLAYHLWHRAAFAAAKKLHAVHHFDFTHQVNMVGYREPGFLWRLPVPFIWGPVGGAQNLPWRFLHSLSWRDASIEAARNLCNSLQLRTSLRVRRAARKASQTLAASSTNQRAMERFCRVPVQTMLDVGVEKLADSVSQEPPVAGRLKILWAGRVEPRKALHLLIEATAQLPPSIDWEVQVLGDGPLQQACRERTRRLGTDHRWKWLGWMDRNKALTRYAWADVLAFTSLRDTSGTVVVEAFSHGVPVVCLDHQGGEDMVTASCGVKIPVMSPRQVVRDLAQALEDLANDPALRLKLREGARRRAELYLWPRLGEEMAEYYDRVLRRAGASAEVREAIATDQAATIFERELVPSCTASATSKAGI
jgi:glycosyltransferase involved in cell wall biosynthesis